MNHKQFGSKALQQERFKQQLRGIASDNNIEIGQVSRLNKYYKKHLLPARHGELLPEDFPSELLDNDRNKKIEEFQTKYNQIAKDYENDITVAVGDYLYQGNEQQLNTQADNLSFEDFVKGLVYLYRKGKPEERLLFLFQILDEDTDSHLSLKEFWTMLTKLAGIDEKDTPLYTWIKKHFIKLDVRKRGVLNFEEWLSIVQKHPTLMRNIQFPLDRVIDGLLGGSSE